MNGSNPTPTTGMPEKKSKTGLIIGIIVVVVIVVLVLLLA